MPKKGLKMDLVSAEQHARRTSELLGITFLCVRDPITDSYHAMQFLPQGYELITTYEPQRIKPDPRSYGMGEQARPQNT